MNTQMQWLSQEFFMRDAKTCKQGNEQGSLGITPFPLNFKRM